MFAQTQTELIYRRDFLLQGSEASALGFTAGLFKHRAARSKQLQYILFIGAFHPTQPRPKQIREEISGFRNPSALIKQDSKFGGILSPKKQLIFLYRHKL